MNSSTSKNVKTLAGRKAEQSLHVLCELANLRDDPNDCERFAKRWPGFVSPIGGGPGSGIKNPQNQEELRRKFHGLLSRRQTIRNIWRGGDSDRLTDLLLPTEPPDDLTWEEADKYVDRDEAGLEIGTLWRTQVVPDWRRGRFIYKPRTDFQHALYLLVSKSRLAKVCENPDCPAPYFIARKVVQRYCSDGCAGLFQRDWKRRWWAEHGHEWRAKRKKGSSGKKQRGGKRRKAEASPKKTRGGNR